MTRRQFLVHTGAAAAAAASACTSSAPAVRTRTVRKVRQVLAGMPTTDGAGVRLERVIGQPALRHLDPFLMLDRFHSDDPGAYIAGFPDHPHRGFETVTVMRAGRMRHRDSVGNHGVIAGGGAQWMTAGRGIIHSEMPEQEQGLMSGYQLWVNLPAAEKMCAPHYQDLRPEALAHASLGSGGSLQVIAGEVDGLAGPVRARATEPILLSAVLADETPLVVETPAGHTAFVFVGAGSVEIGPDNAARTVPEGRIAVLDEGDTIRVRAVERAGEVLVAAGRPLREPIVQYGPFVMNTEAEIRQAIADYRSGRLVQG